MNCRTKSVHKFRIRLGFEQYDVILTKEQSVLTRMSSFWGENMQTQYKVIGYSIDLSFDDYKLPIEINENEHRNRNNDKIIKQKAMEQELGCTFIRIDSNNEDWNF